MINVLESFIQGKAPDDGLCEDAIFANEHFAMVVDGATDKTGWQYGGKLGGRVAAETCVSVLSNVRPGIGASEFFTALTDAFQPLRAAGPEDGPSASVVVVSSALRQIWQVGDAGFRILPYGSKEQLRKAVDVHAAACRALLLESLIAGGDSISSLRTIDPGRQMIKPLLDNQYRFRNRLGEWGYAAVDRTPIPPALIKTCDLEPGPQLVVLASDGYPSIRATLEEAEHELAESLQVDPLCVRQLRGTKAWRLGDNSYDDRAFLKISVS